LIRCAAAAAIFVDIDDFADTLAADARGDGAGGAVAAQLQALPARQRDVAAVDRGESASIKIPRGNFDERGRGPGALLGGLQPDAKATDN